MNLQSFIGVRHEDSADTAQDSETKQRKLSEALSERATVVGEKIKYKLPLSLLENFINVKYKTQAKSGPKAYMKMKVHYGGAAYIRLFMDWSGKSLPKPPAKYFTVKVTPYHAVSNAHRKHISATDSMEYAISEMPQCESEHEEMAWLAMCHDIECDFLEFARRLEEPNIKVPFTVFAKHFTTELSDPGVIIFEDFNKTVGIPITTDLTIECLKEVIDALADVHAACFLTEDYSSQWHFPCSGQLNLTQFMRAIGIFKNANPVLFGQMFDRIHEIIEDVLKTHYENANKQRKDSDLQPCVLVHGFLLSTNLRWKKPRDANDSIEELAYIINWQNVRLGTITEDLLYLLCSSTSPDIRRAAVNELVAHYIARFAQKYGKTVFSVDQILESINREFRFQALRALLPLAEYLAALSDTGEATAAGTRSSTQMTVLLRAKCLVDDLASCE